MIEIPNRLFDTEEKVEQLVAEAVSWNFTPFFAQSRAKGVSGGVDCVNLDGALLATGGMELPPFPDDYPLDWTYHNASSLIEKFIADEGIQDWFSVWPEVIVEDLRPGDMLHFRMENDINHMAMMLTNGKIINCLNPRGVRIVRLCVAMQFGELVKVRTPLKVAA